jgi:hypothetical protein
MANPTKQRDGNVGRDRRAGIALAIGPAVEDTYSLPQGGERPSPLAGRESQETA